MALTLRTFDHALRRPLTGWLAVLGAALVGSALPSGTPPVLRLVVAAMLAGAVAVARWTWIRLWRVGTTPRERVIYDYGVRTVGPVLYVLVVIGFGYQQSAWDRLLRGTPNAWMQLIVLLVTSLPVALAAGFAVGQVRARLDRPD